jgi:hypothetical protein
MAHGRLVGDIRIRDAVHLRCGWRNCDLRLTRALHS